MRLLELSLDCAETERAARFRFESDRRAYIVAHGLRRLALGDLLEVSPGSLVLSKHNSGKPQLIWPGDCEIYFSHAHTREVVAIVLAGNSAVGIDVECIAERKPDFDLLQPYVVLPEASQRAAEVGVNPAVQFFFYWTALEAFWKAAGKGLSPENPRIRCEKNGAGVFEVTLERSDGALKSAPQAMVSRIQALEGCMISVAHQYLQGETGRKCSSSLSSAGAASKKDRFFQRNKRYTDSGFITIVSV